MIIIMQVKLKSTRSQIETKKNNQGKYSWKMNAGPSGFNNAPVTRTIIIASVLFTIVFGISGRSQNLALSYEDIFKNLKIWKLVVSAFGFQSTPELLFGLYLLYYFRVFERQIGSNKYSVFSLFSIAVSLLLEVHALLLLQSPFFNNILAISPLNILTSGPYGLVFALFVPFYFDIPVQKRFRILNLNFSDKTFVYVAGLQLLLSSWKRSMVPGICGILAGCLYRSNIFRIRRRKFPESIASFFSRLAWPSIGGTSPTASSSRIIPENTLAYGGRRVEASHAFPPASGREPSEENITTLVSMGFERNSATQALIRAGNDVNAATDILLAAQGH